MAEIRYRWVYEVKIKASDQKSGKLISNILYYRNQVDTGFAYGDPIPGSSDAVFINSVQANFATGSPLTVDILSENYVTSEFQSRGIYGRAYPQPTLAITSLAPGLTSSIITTSVAHGFSVGDNVSIQGVTGPSGVNGSWNVTQVDTPTQFRIGFVFSGSWTGDGAVQLAAGPQEFTYMDNFVEAEAIDGDIAGEAVPLFSDASIRRINTGVGRNWKSRLSMAPIAETSQLNGKFTTAFATIFGTWSTRMMTAALNAATTNPSNRMMLVAVSKKIAMAQPTPFTTSDKFAQDVTSLVLQPNLGSLVRRKPRLTSVIG